MNSVKTTALGIFTILAAIGGAGKAILDGDPATSFDMATTLAAITAGVGLIVARDNDKTSEEALKK